jgi:hypothetical protein
VVIIHIRLREGIDGDIEAWYEAQADKTQAVKDAIRMAMRLQNGDSQEVVIKAAVAQELARLPGVVAAAVSEALAAYRLAPAEVAREPGQEDPELAARLNEQLDVFFSGDVEK